MEPSQLRLELVDPIAGRIGCWFAHTGSPGRRAEVRAGQVSGDLLRPACCADLAVHHDGHLVGHAEDELGELLHQQDRGARGRDRLHLLVELLDDQRREPHRQLVEQQQRRIGRERTGEREHLLLAARTGGRPAAIGVREAGNRS